MTVQIKKAGAYSAAVGVFAKKTGVYSAVQGMFVKVAGVYQNVLNSRKSLFLGVDSLTEGAVTFLPYSGRMSSQLGDAKISSLIVPITGTDAVNGRNLTQPYVTQSSSGANLLQVRTSTWSSYPQVFSASRFGMRTSAGIFANGNKTVLVCNRAWVKAELFYLWTSASAGSANLWNGDSATKIPLDTQATANRLFQSVTTPTFGISKATIVPDLAAASPYTLTVGDMTGYFAAFEVKFYFDEADSGVSLWNTGIGGQALKDIITGDQTVRTPWYQALGLTGAVINAGMNDGANYASAALFKAALKPYVNKFTAAVADPSKVFVLVPATSSTDITGIFYSAYVETASELGATLIDLPLIAGEVLLGLGSGHRATYAEMNTAGYMYNAVHPSTSFNNWLGDYLIQRYGM